MKKLGEDVGQDRRHASGWMARVSRDRVTIDLRGIGDAVRVAAQARGASVAALVREALVQAIDPQTCGLEPAIGSASDRPAVAKLTLRMRTPDAELLAHNANALGLSYGAYVARLVRGQPLPLSVADREADRAALLLHCDRLAQWAIDAHSLGRLLSAGCFDPALICAGAGEAITADVQRHLDIASRLLAHATARPEAPR